MEKWNIHINGYLDPEAGTLTFKLLTDNDHEVSRICFDRNGVKEKKRILAYLMEWSGESAALMPEAMFFHKTLNRRERALVHELFPYIPYYKNIRSFHEIYERFHSSFSYSSYEDLKELGNRILASEEEAACGSWKMIRLSSGDSFLFCKWRNPGGEHIVLADDRMFYSDLDFKTLCKEEMAFIMDDRNAVKEFLSEHKNTLLDVYLNYGGRRILYFLSAPRYDHIFELLGKSGLSKLADNLENYKNLNRNGKNIPEIFGLPIRCLRALNHDNDLMLYNRDEREILGWAYEKCPDLFDHPLTVVDEMWFQYCFRYQDLEVWNHKTLADLLCQTTRYLNKKAKESRNPYQVFGLYENYLLHSIRIGTFFSGYFPADLEKAETECVDYLQKQYEEARENRFRQAVDSEEYMALEDDQEDEPYRIQRPMTSKDLMLAGKELRNCLCTYTSKIKEGRTMVGLIYEKSKEKLIGAVEVRNNYIIQAKGPCNGLLDRETFEYLERYMKRKQLFYW